MNESPSSIVTTSDPIGVVVPPANPTVEEELGHWLAEPASTVTTRLPAHDGELRGRLESYDQALPDAVRGLGGLRLSAVYYACTGATYLHGRSGEVALAEVLAAVTLAPMVTAAGAVAECLERAEVSSIALVSPYPTWLTEAATAYWRAGGLEVRAVEPIDTGATGIYGVPSRSVHAALTRAADTGADALLITGTGLRTRTTLERWNATEEVPALSSNLAAAVTLTRISRGLGRGRPPEGFARQARERWVSP